MYAICRAVCLVFVLGSPETANRANADTVEPVFCNGNKLRIDLERDGKHDCVVTEMVGTDTVLKVRLSSSGSWIVLNKYSHSDEVIETQRLSGYINPKFTAARVGTAIRLTFPEKSSVLYYWDKKKSAIVAFWESD